MLSSLLQQNREEWRMWPHVMLSVWTGLQLVLCFQTDNRKWKNALTGICLWEPPKIASQCFRYFHQQPINKQCACFVTLKLVLFKNIKREIRSDWDKKKKKFTSCEVFWPRHVILYHGQQRALNNKNDKAVTWQVPFGNFRKANM